MNSVMRYLAVGALALAAGCGDSTSTADMAMPDMAMAPPPPVYYEKNTMQMPANFTCIGTRMDPAGPTEDYVLSGKIVDFQEGDPVVGATVSVYFTGAQVAMNQPLAKSAPSAMDGSYMVTVPKGSYRVIFGTAGGQAITSSGTKRETIPTYEFERKYSDTERTSVTVTTRDAIPGLVSVEPDVTLGVIAGSVRDCDNRETGGAKVAITDTAKAYDANALTFYFVEAGGSALPTRKQKWTAGNGVFAALNVPPGTAKVTASGIVGSGDIKTLGSTTIPVLSGAITIVEVLPTAAAK